MNTKKAIRTEYAERGVDAYYRANALAYENPHFPYIQQLLEQNQERIDYTNVLDLACGGGEVALILRGCGFDNSVGCDPFTKRLFVKNTGLPCFNYSFEDIVKGRLIAKVHGQYSAIISSFAMHLCEEKMLYSLTSQLFLLSQNVVVITPHKRPQLECFSEFELVFEDFVLTERGKKVFLKSYRCLRYD
ncbi:MAG: class I SAM-dependent methyltransferase [Saprospiraceae bacterium]|nr:class I SAM-dependent methyltransferase [Saprospiraceae bacterium]